MREKAKVPYESKGPGAPFMQPYRMSGPSCEARTVFLKLASI
jgi:hypothetical protein